MIGFNFYLWKTGYNPPQEPSRCQQWLSMASYLDSQIGIEIFSGTDVAERLPNVIQSSQQSLQQRLRLRPDRVPAQTSTVDGMPSYMDCVLRAEEAGEFETYKALDKAVQPIRTWGETSESIGEPVPIRISPTPNARESETRFLFKSLGYGGSKLAMQLDHEEALIIPNGVGGSKWVQLVLQEVKVSELHREIGLYSPLNKLVYVFPDPNSDQCVPAYTNPSFADLARYGIYILDRKRPNVRPHHPELRLFEKHEDMLQMEPWRSLMKDMMQDIAKIVFYDLGVGGDSFNIAVVHTEEGYRIRYFGFDFSFAPLTCISLPILENFTLLRGPEERVMQRINRLLIDTAEVISLEHSESTL